jgi:restriction system protein
MTKRLSQNKKDRNRRIELALETLKFGLVIGVVSFVLNSFKQSGFATLGFALSFLFVGASLVLLFLHFSAKKNHPPNTAQQHFEQASNQQSNPLLSERSPKSAEKPINTPTEWSAEVVRIIEWRRFEALVETLFQQTGFRTESQSHGADEGVDIWLFPVTPNSAPIGLVQCKHWNKKSVGVDKVRELAGVMASKKIGRAQFVTSSSFTPEAIRFAKESDINLIDRERLLSLITSRSVDQQAALLNIALEGEYWRPTCVNCGVKMVSRTPKKGGADFWGCAAFPKCKHMMNMKNS